MSSSSASLPTAGLSSLESEDRTAKVWEAQTGKEIVTLKGHTYRISSVVFSPDGTRILTGSLDQTGRVWDTATGKELLTLKGHIADGIQSVCFPPTASVSLPEVTTSTAKISDAETGNEALTLKGHANSVWAVAFSPDGRRIVTGSRDQTARVWFFDEETGQVAGGHHKFTLAK